MDFPFYLSTLLLHLTQARASAYLESYSARPRSPVISQLNHSHSQEREEFRRDPRGGWLASVAATRFSCTCSFLATLTWNRIPCWRYYSLLLAFNRIVSYDVVCLTATKDGMFRPAQTVRHRATSQSGMTRMRVVSLVSLTASPPAERTVHTYTYRYWYGFELELQSLYPVL